MVKLKEINSKNNPDFKLAVKVSRNNIPDFFLVEGPKLIAEALKSNADPVLFFKTPGSKAEFSELNSIGAEIPDQLFSQISTLSTPNNCICIFQNKNQPNLAKVLEKAKLIVVLDRVQDPGNLGNIIRSSEAMGANAVCCLKGTCNPDNSKVIRAAMGSSFRLPVFSNLQFDGLNKSLKDMGFSTICADMTGSSIFNFTFPKRCAIFLGQEGQGLEKFIIDECSIKLAIPMPGQVESLNVAASSAIFLYEWARQQKL
ncbi:MAG: TrmH family RNA methyltransferase [Candidatus Rifleibacteriota bacterium]